MTEYKQSEGSDNFITSFEIQDLFGMYNYQLPSNGSKGRPSSPLLILYGDNGSGKTTILKLIFNLLSPVPMRGHRTFLASTPFTRFTLTLGNKTNIEVKKGRNQLLGSFEVTITKGKAQLFRGLIKANEKNVVTRDETSVLPLQKALNKLKIDLFYLSDDRKAETSSAFEDEGEMWFKPQEAANYILRQGVLVKQEEDQTDEQFLTLAISRLETWVRTQTLKASVEGEANTNIIYSDVVKRIARARHAGRQRPKADVNSLLASLREIERRRGAFSGYTLISVPSVTDLIELLQAAPKITQEIIANVLKPYVDGLKARLNALQVVQNVVGVFLESINSFFHNKSIAFDSDGELRIVNRDGLALSPNKLSSGERQLLLLFCNTVTARDQASIFIIDEPEISLNVKWQRKLLDALLTCTRGSSVQFLIATHSLELLSRHKEYVWKLVDKSLPK